MSAGSISKLLGLGLIRRFRQNLSGTRDVTAGNAVALQVVSGLHAGATLDLIEPLYTLGSSVGSDIVLRDSGIAPEHAWLRRKGGYLEIEAVGGDVLLAGGEIVSMGHGRRCRLPVAAAFGEAQLRLTGPEQPQARASISGRPAFAAAGLLMAAAFMVSIASHALSLDETESPWQSAGQDRKLTKVAVGNGIEQYSGTHSFRWQSETSAAARGPVSAGEAEKQLRLRLAQAGIGTLNVHESHGRLTISGKIPRQQHEGWTGIQSWFDQTYGGKVLLSSDVVAGESEQTPRFALQAVWYGQRPHIITADGTRYYEGAFISDGWVLNRISEKEVLLTKGGATFALKYP